MTHRMHSWHRQSGVKAWTQWCNLVVSHFAYSLTSHPPRMLTPRKKSNKNMKKYIQTYNRCDWKFAYHRRDSLSVPLVWICGHTTYEWMLSYFLILWSWNLVYISAKHYKSRMLDIFLKHMRKKSLRMWNLTWFSNLPFPSFFFFFYREKRSTLAEIVEQLQEREAAQVWNLCWFHPKTVFVTVLCSAFISG